MTDDNDILIQHQKGFHFINLRELINYRDLLTFLVIRDIKVKYKQTVLGGLWAVIQPLFMMVIFTLFFGKLAKIPSDGAPYPLFNFTAMVVWTYFSTAITNAGNSIVGSSNLISKVYFPRIFIPVTPVIAGLLDFAIAFVVLIGMLAFYHIYPSFIILILPVLIILLIFSTSGVGLVLAALNTRYRDIKFTIPFLIQFWMFASPIVYPTSMIPPKYRLIYAVNPMTGIIEGIRSCIIGGPFPLDLILMSVVVSSIIFMVGLVYFKNVERFFADII